MNGPHRTAPGGDLIVAKYHGLANDFLVVVDPPVVVDGAVARRLCDRHRGIGADGLIVGRTVGAAPGTPGLPGPAGVVDGPAATLSFQLFNADGSEAEMSGNGMRCLAHAALDNGLVPLRAPFGVMTPAGLRVVEIHRRGSEAWTTVGMGTVEVRGEVDRCNVGHGQLLVDVGNPHLVVAGTDPSAVDVGRLGPLLERSDPAGLNVEFAALGPGADEVTMRVWERGVGETEACGTGACAAAVAFHHWGRVGTAVTVHQRGGQVAVDIADDGTVRLTGPSVAVAVCSVAMPSSPTGGVAASGSVRSGSAVPVSADAVGGAA